MDNFDNERIALTENLFISARGWKVLRVCISGKVIVFNFEDLAGVENVFPGKDLRSGGWWLNTKQNTALVSVRFGPDNVCIDGRQRPLRA